MFCVSGVGLGFTGLLCGSSGRVGASGFRTRVFVDETASHRRNSVC